jgi:hypothetical protein
MLGHIYTYKDQFKTKDMNKVYKKLKEVGEGTYG